MFQALGQETGGRGRCAVGTPKLIHAEKSLAWKEKNYFTQQGKNNQINTAPLDRVAGWNRNVTGPRKVVLKALQA